MRICAAVIWYRDGAATLRRLVESFAAEPGIVAGVFVDGPFEGRARDVKTIREERDAIDQAAGRVRAGRRKRGEPDFLHYITGSSVYPTEAVKRTVAARLACELFGPASEVGADWLLVIDADEQLTSRIERPALAQLGVALISDPGMYRGGQTMIRLHRLTDSIAWGPSHFEVVNLGLRYATPACLPTNPHHFTIRHYGERVKQDPAYERYNQQERARREHTEPGGVEVAPPTWYAQSRAETIYGGMRPMIDQREVG